MDSVCRFTVSKLQGFQVRAAEQQQEHGNTGRLLVYNHHVTLLLLPLQHGWRDPTLTHYCIAYTTHFESRNNNSFLQTL